VAAIVAFVVDIVASVIVTMFTQPRPAAELTGLVWSLTPRDELRKAEVGADAAWYRKPMLLGGVVLLLALVLNIVFW
jgi:SSS family solute:Na+ symporter